MFLSPFSTRSRSSSWFSWIRLERLGPAAGNALDDNEDAVVDCADTVVCSARIGSEIFGSVLFRELLHGLNGLGDRAVLDSSSSGTIASSTRSNLLFFNGAVHGSWIFLGSASFLLFRNEIGVTCTSTLSSEALGEWSPDMSSSSPPLQKPASLSEPAMTPAFIKADSSEVDSTT